MVGNPKENGLWKRGICSGGVERWPSGEELMETEQPQPLSDWPLSQPYQGLVWPSLEKAFWRSSGKLISAVWHVSDPSSIPCLSAKARSPSSKCSRHFSTGSCWLQGNASGLALGAEWLWLTLLQLYQWGSSVSCHGSQLLFWHSLACTADF